jgi:hypothetical protein
VRRLIHLRSFNALPNTPLGAVGASLRSVSADTIATLLRRGALAYSLDTNTGLPEIKLRALRTTGASALLAQGASSDTIKLLGRWRSDASLRYLHLQNYTRISGFAHSMLQSGTLPTTHQP